MADKNAVGRKRSVKGWSCRVPARYSFAAIASFTVFTTMLTLTFPPVALPAMMRRNVTASSENNTGDVCMFKGVSEQNSSVEIEGEFDWDEVMQSYVLTANSFGLVPSMILAGRLVEIWSPKHMFAISTLVTVLMNMLFPVTAKWSVNAVIVLQFVAGLAMGAPVPALNAMISSWFPSQERQKLAGIIFSAMSLGIIASNSITGKLVDSLGWEYAFYIIPSLLLAWLSVWWLCVYDMPELHPRISKEEMAYITAGGEKDESQTTSKLPWKEMLTSPPVWAHVTMALAPSWTVYTYINNLPTYMENVLHYSSSKAGYFLPIPQLFYWMSIIAFGFISQWVKEKRYIGRLLSYRIFNGIATLGSAACLVAVSQVGCNESEILVLLIAALACSGAYMGGSKLNHMDLAINYAGTLSGLQAAVDVIGSVTAPIVNGIITNNQQTLTAWSKVFYITAAVNVFFFVVYLIFGSVDEQPWNRSVTGSKEDKNQEKSQVSTVDVAE